MEKGNTPFLMLSLMWLMAALFSAQRLEGQPATTTILGGLTDGPGLCRWVAAAPLFSGQPENSPYRHKSIVGTRGRLSLD